MKNKIILSVMLILVLPMQVFALPFLQTMMQPLVQPLLKPIEMAVKKVRRTTGPIRNISYIQAVDETPLYGDVPAVDCHIDPVDKPVYSGEMVSVVKKAVVAPAEFFETKIYIQNTGNMPWFSDDSGCAGDLPTHLGTQNDQDRNSIFFTKSDILPTNWISPSRIQMTTLKVNPGQTAEFDFWSQAPQQDGVYREYFAPVVEKMSWIKGKALVSFDTQVGNPQFSDEMRSNSRFIEQSVNLADPKFAGEKSIHVDLSQQKMQMKIGSTVVKTFTVSSGSYKHPTPVGTTRISLKQPVRIAGETPHYIMPLFMMFRNGGFGFHALPSLANDHGVFWTEALNHIGSPKSHGCIRLLPEDAEVAYNFADVGTLVEVVY